MEKILAVSVTACLLWLLVASTSTSTTTAQSRRQDVDPPQLECESADDGAFDTGCDGDIYFDTLPLCGKGQRLNNTCVTTSQVSDACASCEPGYFQAYNNHCPTCHRCTVCGDHQRTVQNCNSEEDTTCDNEDPVDVVSPSDAGIPPFRPTATAGPSIPTTADETTPDGTTLRTTHGESIKPTTATTTMPSAITQIIEDITKVAKVVQYGQCGTVITVLAVLTTIFALLFVITLVCCVYMYMYSYKTKANVLAANRRRDLNGNHQDEDIELNGQAGRPNDYIHGPTCMTQVVQNEIHDARPPSQPPCLDRPDAGHSSRVCPDDPGVRPPGGLDTGAIPQLPSSQEPLYATVNKTKKSSKAKAADPESVQSVSLKSSGKFSQSPSSSSTGHSPCRRTVCKTFGKVFKRGSGGATKKTHEPGSKVEKDTLLILHPDSCKRNPEQKSPTPTSQSLDDHKEAGGSKASPPKHLTVPPLSASPTPSPLPSPLPIVEQPLQQLTVTSPPPPPPPPALTSSLQDMHLNSTDNRRLSTDTTVKDSDVGESGGGEDTGGDDATMKEQDMGASSGSRVTDDLERGAEGGAGSLPLASPGAKPKVKEPEPGGDVGEETKEEMNNLSIDPDEVVSEQFLDGVTYVINLEEVERIGRKLGLQQISLDNIKQTKSFSSPRTIGFHILHDALKHEGCKLTFRCMLITMRDCGQKEAGDKLIAEFRIDMDLGKR